MTIISCVPSYAVTDVRKTRDYLVSIGFNIIEGSTQHAILELAGTRIRLYTGQEQTIELTITVDDLNQYRQNAEITPVGWGMQKATISHDNIFVTYVQAKPVYQC